MLRFKSLLLLATLLTAVLLIVPSKGWAAEVNFLEVLSKVWPIFTAIVGVLAVGAFWVSKISSKVNAYDQRLGEDFTRDFARLNMTAEQTKEKIDEIESSHNKRMDDSIKENRENLKALSDDLKELREKCGDRFREIDKEIQKKNE